MRLTYTAMVLLLGLSCGVLRTSTRVSLGAEDAAQPTTARLRMVDSSGAPVVASLYLGRVGYSDDLSRLPSWASNREGIVELDGLAAGEHTFVANPAGVNPTIFQIELPTEVDVVEQRMAPQPKWRAGGRVETLEARASVTTSDEEAEIQVELTNKTDDPIRLPTLTMTDMDVRVIVHSVRPAAIWPGLFTCRFGDSHGSR